MSCALASSEHAVPHSYDALRFNTAHMTGTVLVGEVPPADMRRLLVDEWRCGPALATALLAAYGGHVWRASLAIDMLSSERAGFAAMAALPVPSGIDECFASLNDGEATLGGDSIDTAGLEDVLRDLATWRTVLSASRRSPSSLTRSARC